MKVNSCHRAWHGVTANILTASPRPLTAFVQCKAIICTCLVKRVSPFRGAVTQQTRSNPCYSQGKGCGVDLSPWCCSAQTVQGFECSSLCIIYTENTSQMRCSQDQGFGQKQKWDSRSRSKVWISNKHVLAELHQQGGMEDWTPSFISYLSSIFSPFLSLFTSCIPGVPLVETLFNSHPRSNCFPFLCCSCYSWHIPTTFLLYSHPKNQTKTKKRMCSGVFFTYLYYKFAQSWADSGANL